MCHLPDMQLCLCRLVNRSGLRLSYWTDDAGEDGEAGCAYSLNPWEESPLLVDPLEKTVIIPDTQQQVRTVQQLILHCNTLLYAACTHDVLCTWKYSLCTYV